MVELTLEKAILIAMSLILFILFIGPVFLILLELFQELNQIIHTGSIIIFKIDEFPVFLNENLS